VNWLDYSHICAFFAVIVSIMICRLSIVLFISLVTLCRGNLTDRDVETVSSVYLKPSKDRNVSIPVLECKLLVNVPVKFHWQGPHASEESSHYTITSTDSLSVVNFTRVGEHDIGTWTCNVTDEQGNSITKQANLYSSPHVRPLPRSFNLVEGEEVTVECNVYGWPVPNLSWRRGDVSLNGTEDRVTIFNNTLKIVDLKTEDRDDYVCVASSTVSGEQYEETSSTLIRVKDNLAPLWPFLGILAEVIILAVIIVSYECYRRNKKADDEKTL